MDKNALTHQYDCANIDWVDAAQMYESVGWLYRTSENVRLSFEKSSHVYFIKDGDRIVAFGRTVDDGMYYGLIVDVAVHPAYQGQGLGTQIVAHLKSAMKGYHFITLTAAPGKESFYEKIGWKRQKSAFLWPKDSLQEDQHCF